jgi:hypothetical protein
MNARTSLAALAFVIPLCGCVVENAIETPDTSTKVETAKIVETATADELTKPLMPAQRPGNAKELQRRTYTEFENTMGFGGGRMQPSPGHLLPFGYVTSGASLDFTKAYPPTSPLNGRWKVAKLELVGTMHEPAGTAYDTKKGEWAWKTITAASLAERRAAKAQTPNANHLPTRSLDEFENESLATFRDGGNLELRVEGDRLHMVGAIRAMNASCVNCHKVEKGHLMGAFSYELRRLGKDEVVKEEAAEANPVP